MKRTYTVTCEWTFTEEEVLDFYHANASTYDRSVETAAEELAAKVGLAAGDIEVSVSEGSAELVERILSD